MPISDSADEIPSFESSVLDLLEWDNECLSQDHDKDLLGDGVQQQERNYDTLNEYYVHSCFKKMDYDGSSESSRHTSRRSSTELNMKYIRRFPPSGRSSLERESTLSRLSDFSTESDDITLTCTKPYTHSQQIGMGSNLPKK